MTKRKLALIGFFSVLALLVSTFGYNLIEAQVEVKHDQELFLAGANAIGEGKYEQGRILLKTLIYTYADDSHLTQQAKLLVFYSYAREGGQRNEEAQKLLRQVEEHLNTIDPKPRIP